MAKLRRSISWCVLTVPTANTIPAPEIGFKCELGDRAGAVPVGAVPKVNAGSGDPAYNKLLMLKL